MKTTEKHTPGPHMVEQIGRRPIMKAVSSTVLSSSGERLADFRHVADANLFAAAPELLEALRKIAAPIEGVAIGDPWAFYADMQELARAALTKAEPTP